MGSNAKCSWDDRKAALNLQNHGYAFDDLEEIFDGRLLVTRPDLRHDYGEERFNLLASFRGRIVNVTFTPRMGKVHLISVRPASREERQVFREREEDC